MMEMELKAFHCWAFPFAIAITDASLPKDSSRPLSENKTFTRSSVMASINAASPRTLCWGMGDLSCPEGGVLGSRMTLDAVLVDSVSPPLAGSRTAVEIVLSDR